MPGGRTVTGGQGMVGKFRKWVPKPPGPRGAIPSGAKGAGREGGRPAGKPVTACQRPSPGFRRAGSWLCPTNRRADTELSTPGWEGPTRMASSQSLESTPHALVCWSTSPPTRPPVLHGPRTLLQNHPPCVFGSNPETVCSADHDGGLSAQKAGVALAA